MQLYKNRQVHFVDLLGICLKHRHDILLKSYCLINEDRETYEVFTKNSNQLSFSCLDWEHFYALKENILINGILYPLFGQKINNLYHVWNGCHRAAIALAINLDKIPFVDVITHKTGEHFPKCKENMFCYADNRKTEMSDFFLSNMRRPQIDEQKHFGQLFTGIDKNKIKSILTFFNY